MRWVTLMLAAMALGLSGCGDDPPTFPGGGEPDLSVTPMENAEAELAALWLSGKIVAPVSLYNQIDHDLKAIRNQWSHSIGEVQIGFVPCWRPSRLRLGFDSATYDLVVNGQYDAWDSLNDSYSLDTMIFKPRYDHVTLTFKGRLNPMVLVDEYAGLPGLRYVQTSSAVGDRPVLLIHSDLRQLKYFFRNAWGDCPSGCIWSHYFYFVLEDDSAAFKGSYLYQYQDNDRPAWYDTVMMAWWDYLQSKIWWADTTQ